MSAKEPIWPEATSELLNKIISAFRRRAKAIKYRLSDWKLAVDNSGDFERLDMDFVNLGTDIRLIAWSDGALWFRACKGGNDGWDLNYSFHGRAKENASEQIRDALEKSLDCVENETTTRSMWSAFNPKKKMMGPKSSKRI